MHLRMLQQLFQILPSYSSVKHSRSLQELSSISKIDENSESPEASIDIFDYYLPLRVVMIQEAGRKSCGLCKQFNTHKSSDEVVI